MTELRESSDTETITLRESKFLLCITRVHVYVYSTAVKFVTNRKRDRVSRFKSRLVKRDCGAFCIANRDRLSRRVCQKRDRGNTKRDRV